MVTEKIVEIDAPAQRVWSVFVDVERWPGWTASVEHIQPLDGAGLEVGRRFEIKQPRFPRLVWRVTALTEGASWTWEQRSFASRATATHEITPRDDDRVRVRLRVEQRGVIGTVVGFLSRGLTRRYLELEAQGLKARCEQDAG